MQAIETKFIAPTNHRGQRIRVTCQSRSIMVSWDYALDVNENHAEAARKLANQLEWFGMWVEGGKADGKGNVYVCIERYKTMSGVDIKRL